MVSEVIKWCIINIIRGSSFLMNLLLFFGLSTVHLQLRKVAFANQESISREIIAGHSGHFILNYSNTLIILRYRVLLYIITRSPISN